MLSVHPAGTLEDAVWIDLLDPTEEEVARVQSVASLTIPTREALSEIENSSRLRFHEKTLFLSTPVLSRGGDEITPMGFVLTQSRLITIRFVKLKAVEDAIEEALAIDEQSSVCAFVLLLEALVDRGADLLESSGAELDTLSRRIFRGERDKRLSKSNQQLRNTLTEVGRLGDRLGKIRGSLLGVSRIVPFASEVARDWISPDFQARLSAARADVLSLADYETHLEGKTQFMLDAVLGFISTEQNDLFKVLTIVSVVGVPPTLIASIYGMNFAIIPELHWSYGYPYALAMIVLSCVVPMIWFKWKGWW